ncbi:tetratricopeptide repeat protein [Acetobacter orientalis]|uniref:tetratricopeptide repeat protein n=2 Tax=Acetobacter orientalis TaxID=146474 RepID=UPI0039ED212F
MHTASPHTPLTLAETALGLLAQGKAEQAAALLRPHLAQNPQDGAAWHAFGCVALANGSAQAAVQCVAKALELESQPHFYSTQGQALLALGHAEAARAALHVAIMQSPRDPRPHQLMAEALEALGRFDNAAQALRNAVRLRPLESERQVALAAFLARHGQMAEALVVSRHAVAIAPHSILAQNQHALLLERADKLPEATQFFGAVAQALPDNAAALANYGAALYAKGDFAEARSIGQRSADLQPEAAETQNNVGLSNLALGALPEAMQALEQARKLAPHDARIATNYGTALSDMGYYTQAEALFRQVEATPSITALERARARFNLATVLLTEGRFKEGWACFEARKNLQTGGAFTTLPAWQGQAQTQPVLLYAEQGLGDYLHFLRYVNAAACRAPVVLVVPQVLCSLVAHIVFEGTYTVQVVARGDAGHTHGAVSACSVLSLPHIMGMSAPFAWLPRFKQPLLAPEKKQQGLRIGVCWSGNPTYRFDKRRSIELTVLEPLCTLPGITVQALQPEAHKSPFTLTPLPQGDMLQTARLIATLDCVVSVDTAVVHLAGLLGKPTWLLNRFGGDWRWAKASTKVGGQGQVMSLWYPHTHVITQQKPGEGNAPWHEPVRQVTAALCKLVKKGV